MKRFLILLFILLPTFLLAQTKQSEDSKSTWIYPKSVPHHQQDHRSWKFKPYIEHDKQGKAFHLWIEATGFKASNGCCNTSLLFVTDNGKITLESEGRLKCGYAAIPGMGNCAVASWDFPVAADIIHQIATSQTVELTAFSKENGKQIGVRLSKEQIAVFREMMDTYDSLTIEPTPQQ